MDVVRSRVDPADEQFRHNREAMLARVAELERLHADAVAAGGERAVRRHRERGKLTVRERIDLLIDPHGYFLELSPLAAWGTEFPLGGSIVTGIGTVAGVECVVAANDPTVRGGAINPHTTRKWLRALDIAAENRLPLVQLTESGGGDLPTQADTFLPAGQAFRDMTTLSVAGVPTISVVFGNATAGGAYVPGMSDYTVLVRDRARAFLGGPPLVKVATGEDAEEEALGGALMHATTSGLADHLAADEVDAIRIARDIVAHLRWCKAGGGPRTGEPDPPLADPEDLLGIAPAEVRQRMDPREVLARVVDGSRLEVFKPLYGPALLTGWAEIMGYPVGVVANDGVLRSEEAEKAAQFIALCNQVDTPLVFVQHTTGYVVGTEYEQRGITKDGSKMVRAVSASTVPHLTLMAGASYGAGNYGMSGRPYAPRLVLAWPSQRVGIMGSAQMAGVLSIVARQAATARGEAFDEDADEERRAAVEAQLERESTALFATGRQWDDGIIDPRHTRTVLGIALSVVHSAPVVGSTDFGPVRQ